MLYHWEFVEKMPAETGELLAAQVMVALLEALVLRAWALLLVWLPLVWAARWVWAPPWALALRLAMELGPFLLPLA